MSFKAQRPFSSKSLRSGGSLADATPTGGAAWCSQAHWTDYDFAWFHCGGILTAGNGIAFAGNTIHFAQAAAAARGRACLWAATMV
jgi:hypothetical protein